MTDIVIRPAQTDDIVGLVTLDSFAVQDRLRAVEIASWVDAGWCFCALYRGKLSGYGVMHRHFFDQPMLVLVMVGQEYRRLGIGRRLINHARDLSDAPYLWTSTNRSNAPMRALLSQMGFTMQGEIEGLDEGDPELFFRIANDRP